MTGAGDDVITVLDQLVDRAACGLGTDRATADDADLLLGREGPNTVAPVPPKFHTTKAEITATTKTLKIKRKTFRTSRKIAITLTSNEPVMFDGQVLCTKLVKSTTTQVAAAAAPLGQGKRNLTFRVSAKVAKQAYKLAGTKLFRKTGFPMTVNVNAIDRDGNVTKVAVAVRVTR